VSTFYKGGEQRQQVNSTGASERSLLIPGCGVAVHQAIKKRLEDQHAKGTGGGRKTSRPTVLSEGSKKKRRDEGRYQSSCDLQVQRNLCGDIPATEQGTAQK